MDNHSRQFRDRKRYAVRAVRNWDTTSKRSSLQKAPRGYFLIDGQNYLACAHNGQHILFPILVELFDAKIAPDTTTREKDETSMLLTVGLHQLPAEISEDGILAYIETEHFGGQGGQGAMVVENGKEIMRPGWSESYTVNKTLRLLGLRSTNTEDEFLMLGPGMARNSQDLLSPAMHFVAGKRTSLQRAGVTFDGWGAAIVK